MKTYQIIETGELVHSLVNAMEAIYGLRAYVMWDEMRDGEVYFRINDTPRTVEDLELRSIYTIRSETLIKTGSI